MQVRGDPPSLLRSFRLRWRYALIPNGLSVPAHPEWGGWGGRYELYVPELSAMDPKGFTGGVPIEPETRPIWTNAIDEYIPPVTGEHGRSMRAGEKSFKDYRATVWCWRDEFQNDFAARMDPRLVRSGRRQPELPVVSLTRGGHLQGRADQDWRRGEHCARSRGRTHGGEARDDPHESLGHRQRYTRTFAISARHRHGDSVRRGARGRRRPMQRDYGEPSRR